MAEASRDYKLLLSQPTSERDQVLLPKPPAPRTNVISSLRRKVSRLRYPTSQPQAGDPSNLTVCMSNSFIVLEWHDVNLIVYVVLGNMSSSFFTELSLKQTGFHVQSPFTVVYNSGF